MTDLDALAFEFFREFARCECCLKVAGFRRTTQKGVEPDWDSFARTIDDSFNPNVITVGAAVKYFFENPPKKQVVENNRLVWANDDYTGRQDTTRLLVLVRRVRNNLFHGGKFNGHWFAPQRSRELLGHGLVVLKVCIDSHPNLREAYDNSDPPLD